MPKATRTNEETRVLENGLEILRFMMSRDLDPTGYDEFLVQELGVKLFGTAKPLSQRELEMRLRGVPPNDFLRALGETGLLGFLAFFGIISFVIYQGIKSLKKIDDQFYFTLTACLVAATFGFLVNAIYIDVFEASKDAYTFWILVALLFTTIKLSQNSAKR